MDYFKSNVLSSVPPSLIISVCALLFTVLSFWWMNWRRGKLHVGPPCRYTALSSEKLLLLELPLTFFNDGPIPIIVQNLRLVFVDKNFGPPLKFEATLKTLRGNEDRAFSTQLPVRGREAILVICEFQRQPSAIELEARTYPMEVQAQLDKSKKWKTVCPFLLRVEESHVKDIKEISLIYDVETAG